MTTATAKATENVFTGATTDQNIIGAINDGSNSSASISSVSKGWVSNIRNFLLRKLLPELIRPFMKAFSSNYVKLKEAEKKLECLKIAASNPGSISAKICRNRVINNGDNEVNLQERVDSLKYNGILTALNQDFENFNPKVPLLGRCADKFLSLNPLLENHFRQACGETII